MNGSPVNGSRSTQARRRLRLAALIVAVICVLALAAAAFVLSYPGARDTALHAGVTPKLARIYPAIFDAVLLVACAAALALRGALRGYAWLALLVVTAAIAAADATHAMAVTLPKRPMEATVAVVPWAVLLIGFTLLYAIARQGRSGWTAAQGSADLSRDRADSTGEDLSAAGRLDPPAGPGNGMGPHHSAATVPLSDLLTVKPLVAKTGPAAAKPAPAPQAGPPAEPKPPRTKRARRKAAAQTQPTSPEPGVTPEPTAPALTATQEPPATTEPTATTEPPATTEPTVPTEAPASSEPAIATESSATSESTVAPEPTVTPETTVATEPTEAREPTEAADSAAVPEPAPVQEPVLSDEPTASQEPEDASEPIAAQGTTATLPELPRRRSVLRDEPSDADAESAEPAAYFNRLRSSPTPPED
jgi:Protein of unknown function (DUF2637)